MGKILSGYKKAVVDEIVAGINNNTSFYYAFASNPVQYPGQVPQETNDDYSSRYQFDWNMLFGKKLANTDIVYVCNNYQWTSNTVYTRYDNTSNTLANSQYYVITQPDLVGGDYIIYKCIDNANGQPSTQKPDQVQAQSFQKSDNYIWRYIGSISSANYTKFATTQFAPIYSNTTIVSGAYNYSGVEVVVIANSGTGYNSYNDGTVQSVVNTTLIQISANASLDNDFYKNNGVYLYNNTSATAQLLIVNNYVSNLTGNWVIFSTPANTTNITPGVTQYKISPQIKFDSDGDSSPKAYSIINTQTNAISNVVIIDTGYGITRATAQIVSNTAYGTGANLYCICPPPGGHGSDPANELGVNGLAISFKFTGTESNNIPGNVPYNKIGIIRNPYSLNANNTKGSLYTSNTFSQVLKATISPSATFTVGETVTGNTSGAKGIVCFSNSSTLYLSGDKDFVNNEYIISANGVLQTQITISTLGNLYTKEINPFYVQNTDNITRSNTQNEAFKIIIEI